MVKLTFGGLYHVHGVLGGLIVSFWVLRQQIQVMNYLNHYSLIGHLNWIIGKDLFQVKPFQIWRKHATNISFQKYFVHLVAQSLHSKRELCRWIFAFSAFYPKCYWRSLSATKRVWNTLNVLAKILFATMVIMIAGSSTMIGKSCLLLLLLMALQKYSHAEITTMNLNYTTFIHQGSRCITYHQSIQTNFATASSVPEQFVLFKKRVIQLATKCMSSVGALTVLTLVTWQAFATLDFDPNFSLILSQGQYWIDLISMLYSTNWLKKKQYLSSYVTTNSNMHTNYIPIWILTHIFVVRLMFLLRVW